MKKFVAILIFLGCSAVSHFSRASGESYYDYRDGNRYICTIESRPTPPRPPIPPVPECRYASDCQSGYTCKQGSCERQQITCMPHCTGGYYDSAGTQCRSFGADQCSAD